MRFFYSRAESAATEDGGRHTNLARHLCGAIARSTVLLHTYVIFSCRRTRARSERKYGAVTVDHRSAGNPPSYPFFPAAEASRVYRLSDHLPVLLGRAARPADDLGRGPTQFQSNLSPTQDSLD